jgi:DNA-directed RNA polymerase subunit RPC12/RpoP
VPQLPVYTDENGKPQIECPGCGELISPSKSRLFDSYDCPECDTPIHVSDMKRYKKAMDQWEDEEDYLDE